jgi:hypothetical protein
MAWERGHDSIEGSVERQNPLKGKGHETICGRLCTPGTGEGVENPDWFCQRLEKGNRPPIVEKLREATKKAAEDKAFNEMIEKPGDEVYYLHGDEVMKHIQKEAKTISEIDQELVKEAPKK